LLTDTGGLKALNQLVDGLSMLQPVLNAANINSMYRVDEFKDGNRGADGNKGPDENKGADGNKGDVDYTGTMLLLGRRQRIAHGGAAAASCGEEPMDIAVSVPPSLEVVGETNNGDIEMAVRIRFVPRLTDKYGVVGVVIS
jgi:hypothetical protein